jgi:signal transduction histidine kinase
MKGKATTVDVSPETGPFTNFAFTRIAEGNRQFLKFIEVPLPAECLSEAEPRRRATIICRFGTLSAFFGVIYAAFYLLIGHFTGAVIVLVCSSCFAATPFLIRGKASIEPAGHLLILILMLGCTALCFAEGALQGHALAWLVSVPLCALLMLGQRAATRWAIIAFFAAGVAVTLDLAGIRLPPTHDVKWNPIVTAAGYLGLLIYMFVLGLTFEISRARAYSKMQEALAALAVSNERLVHLNNEKSEFLGIAAHDLKNPLTIIMGSAAVARTLENRGEIDGLLDDISAAAARMHELTANLLDINAIEHHGLATEPEACDLGALVKKCVEGNRSGAAKKHITLSLEATTDLWAKTDPAAFRQILDNLLSNALKFSGPQTTIRVSACREPIYIAIAVCDEGPGLSEADQKKLFQKFSRLSARPTGGESSTGLGLAIVKKLIEAMAGTVECRSSPGAGATFTLRIPAIPLDAQ